MRAPICLALLCAAACRAPETEPPRTVELVAIRDDAGAAVPTTTATTDVAAEADASACEVRVLTLTDAAVRAGPRSSPQREATLARLDPKTRSAWRGRDHALRHLLCTYRIQMNGVEWTYVHLAGEGLAGSPRLDPAPCSTPEGKQAVEARIRDFTHQCTDPHAGAYEGDDLVP